MEGHAIGQIVPLQMQLMSRPLITLVNKRTQQYTACNMLAIVLTGLMKTSYENQSTENCPHTGLAGMCQHCDAPAWQEDHELSNQTGRGIACFNAGNDVQIQDFNALEGAAVEEHAGVESHALLNGILTTDRSFKFMYSPSLPAAPPLSGQGFLHDCSPVVTVDSA